ncbi:peptidylprolyl isomerase [Arcobacter sp. F155]|uniref:FKBP-type peptidyl-prolyl cis-trans isomerase n=1 Tax=Arcobacteraceae TaxID=2808963 RepID=UPI00100AA3FC|nr:MULTISPECIES: peptidylprolyl isomerase [unclassified Arcobacter]RXJ77901.1 peptidylprolyl isomerase [Arcobacter sp. F155]RXK03643.1 peptidylprolyl isomerase [Arcobacter sp. CECT 8989]
MGISKNSVVSMSYEVRLNDEVIDSNKDNEPIKFIHGTGEIIAGLEKGIVGMEAGETKDIKVAAIDAYGEHDPKLTETLPIADFEGIDLEIGLVLEADGEKGEIIKATVTEVTKDEVTIDYNHPLAGCDLDFKVTIHSVL